jgi:ribosome-associated protein
MRTLAEKKTTKKTVRKTGKKTSVKPDSTDLRFALKAAEIARDRHCSDIVALDLRGISPATDYFVIATSTSGRQAKTVADEISEAAGKFNLQRFGRAGYEQGQWILLDFVNVVVHLFDREHREYYNLEMLWGDAKKLNIDE